MIHIWKQKINFQYSARKIPYVRIVPHKCGLDHKNKLKNVQIVRISKLKMSVGSVILTVLKVNKGY